MSPTIPKDSLVLVTGVSGFVGSHVADQLLLAGYRVRGTTRDISKVHDLSTLWETKYGPNRVEFVAVPNMAAPDAYKEAVKGVSGIAHVASNMTFSTDAHAVVTEVLDGIHSILSLAAAEPSVKSFVYTSSSVATTSVSFPLNTALDVDSNTWNAQDIKDAYAPPPHPPHQGWIVYGASKALGEKALWDFVEKEKPGFVVNSVLPNGTFGRLLFKDQPPSSTVWVKTLYNGNDSVAKTVPPRWFVDVQDVARLHVAALINPDVKNERLFAYSESFTWNDVLRVFKKLRPEKTFPEAWANENDRDISTVTNERGAQLLKEFGRNGWTGLEESVGYTIEGL